MAHRAMTLGCLLVATAALPGIAFGQSLLPDGDEFQANTYTTGGQQRPNVAFDGLGNFVVVWSSPGSFGGDTSGRSVLGQRYAADGNPLGAEFQVNSYTQNNQILPAVSANANGEFVVVWESYGSGGSDHSLYSVQAQRFEALGLPVGAQLQVNSYTTGLQTSPVVAVDDDGDFVAAWDSTGSDGTDTSGRSIQLRLFASDGSPLGPELQVNTYTTSDQADPAIAMVPDGSFVVVWMSDGSAGTDVQQRSIQGRRFTANGTPLGDQFQVNTYTTGQQYNPSLTVAAGGEFVVAWSSNSSEADSDYCIRAQRFAADGSFAGGELQVNTYTTNNQVQPAVAASADGSFLVVWRSGDASHDGPDGSKAGISGQVLAANGALLDGELVVNTYTANNQYSPAVAAASDFRFVVAWQSLGSFGTDTLAESVDGQAFLDVGVFADDFESGDTGAWSVAVP